MSLSGQTAIITGGGRGLGRAFAIALADAGVHVVITARSENELRDTVKRIEQKGGAATFITADVTDPEATQQVIATVEQQVGPINLLINNAGSLRALGVISDVDAEEWWREIEINLRGPFLYTKAVLPRMIERSQGRIINVASEAGLFSINTGSAYCVSKAALIRLTESTAIETESYGIKVFVIHPGTVRTPMNDYLYQSPEVKARAPEIQQAFQQRYATNDLTPIEQSVNLVLQLASGQADALTGSYISVNDDIARLIQQADTIQEESRRKLRMQL
jgi:NAD(P)-dependent dehydrogenase (short-subunit alcohol dehydrogenase family)